MDKLCPRYGPGWHKPKQSKWVSLLVVMTTHYLEYFTSWYNTNEVIVKKRRKTINPPTTNREEIISASTFTSTTLEGNEFYHCKPTRSEQFKCT